MDFSLKKFHLLNLNKLQFHDSHLNSNNQTLLKTKRWNDLIYNLQVRPYQAISFLLMKRSLVNFPLNITLLLSKYMINALT